MPNRLINNNNNLEGDLLTEGFQMI